MACRSGRGEGESQCQGGLRTLLIKLVADGKKLFLWREVLVPMDRNLLPEGVSRVCDQGGRDQPQSSLHASECWRDGRLQPVTFSADRMTRCSLPLSLGVAAAYQMVMEEVRMDSMMEE